MIPDRVEHIHRYSPALGAISIKVERNTRGTTYEVSVSRPRREGETDDDARLAALAQVDAAMLALGIRYRNGQEHTA